MKTEIQEACKFIASLAERRAGTAINARQKDNFEVALTNGYTKYQSNKWPDKRNKRYNFRERAVVAHKEDIVFKDARQKAGISVPLLNEAIPDGFLMWINPGHVSFRMEQNGRTYHLYRPYMARPTYQPWIYKDNEIEMIRELHVTSLFIIFLMEETKENIGNIDLMDLKLHLQQQIRGHLWGHWYQGQGHPIETHTPSYVVQDMEPIIFKAGKTCGIQDKIMQQITPHGLVMKIAPGRVCMRLGNTGYFTQLQHYMAVENFSDTQWRLQNFKNIKEGMEERQAWRNLPNEEMLPERTARHVLKTEDIKILRQTNKTITLKDIKRGVYRIGDCPIAYDTFIPDADYGRIEMKWENYINCYIVNRITNHYIRSERRYATTRGAKFRHNIHILREAMKTEANSHYNNGNNLWELHAIVERHLSEHMEVLRCNCRIRHDCEICHMTMEYEDLKSELRYAAYKTDLPEVLHETQEKQQKTWPKWTKKITKPSMKLVSNAMMMITVVVLLGTLTRKIPYARAENPAIGNFIFKDLGSYTLHPTYLSVTKTINYTNFLKQYEQLENLHHHHKKLCQTDFKILETNIGNKSRSQFKALLNEFGFNDTPRNYEESKQFCELHGAHLPEIRM
jgi:hypothetical protein